MSTLLSVNNYYYRRGGAETVYLEQNRLFQESGWNVVPFSMQHPKNQDTSWSRYFVDEIEFGQSYSFRQKLARLPKVIYSREARRKLALLIDDTRPDICHAHNIYHHISPSILGLLKQREIPVVLTLHDLKIACPAYSMLASDGICERCRGGRLHNVVIHRCLKGSVLLSSIAMVEALLHRLIGSYDQCVSRFVVPSRFYIEKLCEWGWSKSRFAHVPNFVNADRYVPRYETGNAFMYFGRISREKGLKTLIRAAAAVHAPVVLVGDGPQIRELRALADELRADISFLGYLSGEPLHSAIRSARAVVLPSEWYENAPLTVLEAYALGKPIIGARIGGIPELVREDETGLGFVSGDVASLSEALVNFLNRPNAAVAEMGRCARRWVEGEFTATRYRDRIVAIYSELGVKNSGTPNIKTVISTSRDGAI
jgi:glycosyltransferase involved in cell wall biosynthesis